MAEMVYLSTKHQTGNFWIDNGLVYLLIEWGDGEHEADDILNALVNKLVQPTGNKGEYYDVQAQQMKEYDKRNWVEPANLFIKVSGDSGEKVEIGGKKYYVQPPAFKLNIALSNKQSVCDVCGETAKVTDAKMWMYPFVVDPGNFGNFYSGAKRGVRLCARCALAGLAAYLSWWWCRQGKDVVYFFLFHTDIAELQRLHVEVLRPLQLAEERVGNVPAAFAGKYLHETVLGVLLFLFSHIPSSDVLSDTARQFLASLFEESTASTEPVVLYAAKGIRAKAFDMKELREFSHLQQLYRLYDGWKRVLQETYGFSNPHQQIVRILEQFWAQRQREWETLWRDKVAYAILNQGDPLPVLEEFLFDVLAKQEPVRPLRRGTVLILVDYYLKEVFQMDEQFIRTLSGFGHELGAAAHEKGEMGLLFALRNTKNAEEFYRVLNDVQFRLGVTVPESLLRLEKGERIASSPWKRVKHMLAIYAMNAYLRKEPREALEEKREEEAP